VAADLAAALAAEPKAQAMFERLNSRNRYAVIYAEGATLGAGMAVS
jgi:uncharacterized protein YdeI (YjbR/CyaY-like superfamily)